MAATSKHVFVAGHYAAIKLDADRKPDLKDNTDHQRDVISRRRDRRARKIPAIMGLRPVGRARGRPPENLESGDFRREFTRTHRSDMSRTSLSLPLLCAAAVEQCLDCAACPVQGFVFDRVLRGAIARRSLTQSTILKIRSAGNALQLYIG